MLIYADDRSGHGRQHPLFASMGPAPEFAESGGT